MVETTDSVVQVAAPSRIATGLQVLLDSSRIRVVEAEARALDVPLISPFTIASSRLEYVRNVAIRVKLDDGSLGWGEAPILPAVTEEDQPVALAKALELCSELKKSPVMSCRKVLEKISILAPGHDYASVSSALIACWFLCWHDVSRYCV